MRSSHVRQVGCWCALCLLYLESLRALPTKSSPHHNSNLWVRFWPSAPTNRQDPDTSSAASPATTFNTIQLPSPASGNQNCPELGNKTFSTKNVQQPSTVAQNSPKLITSRMCCQALWCTSITAANITSHTIHSRIFWGWEVESLVEPAVNHQFPPIFWITFWPNTYKSQRKL